MEAGRVGKTMGDFLSVLSNCEPTGFLLILSSPSGGGKTTIARALTERYDYAVYSVSTTTRPKRPEEKDGKAYHFVTGEEFEQRIAEDKFAEWADVHGNLYGTEKEQIENYVSSGKVVVMDLDVQGALNIRKTYSDAVLVFITPPSFENLKERLRLRGSESQDTFDLRLRNAKNEVSVAHRYDYLVINDVLDKSVDMVGAIMEVERHKIERLKKL